MLTTACIAVGFAAGTDQWLLFRADERVTMDGLIPGYLQPPWTSCVSATRTPMNAGADLSEYTLLQTQGPTADELTRFEWNEGAARLRLDRHRYGWPLRAAFIDTHGIQGDQGKEETFRLLNEADDSAGLRTGVVLFKGQGNTTIDPRIPLALLPIGFVGNTVFFGSLWWLVLFGPGTLKRRRRLTRGLCIRCGYQLDQTDPCPECGTPARKAQV